MIEHTHTLPPTIKERVQNLLLEIEDENDLLEIARSIHKRILALNSPKESDAELHQLKEPTAGMPDQKRSIEIQLRNDTWFATRKNDGRSFGLCPRLSKSEIEKQHRVKEPNRLNWEISADEANQLKKEEPQRVDFWDDKKGNITTRHFYLVDEYNLAMDDWRKYISYAKDQMTQDLGLSVAARAAIEQLKQDGYEIVFQDKMTQLRLEPKKD